MIMATFENLEIVLGRDERGRIFGTQRDELGYGNDGDDIINLRGGNDILFGQGGDDFLVGLAGDDILVGGSGNDELRGGLGNDRLDGQFGDDVLAGQGGDDIIRGRGGEDVINGGTGNDILSGGADADVFLFDPSAEREGRDRIADFEVGVDRVLLNAEDVIASEEGILDDIIAGGGTVDAVFAALDASEGWRLLTGANGDLIVFHPGGSIRLAGVSGEGVTSFSDLADALVIAGLGEALSGISGDSGGRPTIAEELVARSGVSFDSNPDDFDILIAALDDTAPHAITDPDESLSLMAPNDAAFLSLAARAGYTGTSEGDAYQAILDALAPLGDGDPLPVLRNDVLAYHVVDAALTLNEMQGLGTVPTFADGEFFEVEGTRVIDRDPDSPDARVIEPDIVTGNGLIHVIDEVLLPLLA